MLERRAKQALQSALPSGFWGMPPPEPPRTSELEPWQITQPPQPQQHWGDAPPPTGDLEPWQILQRLQPQQPESVRTTYSYSAGPPPPPEGPPAKHWGTPPRSAGSMLNTIAQRLDELNAKVDYIAGQVQVLMDQSCQAV